MQTCTPYTQKAPQTKATTRKRHHKQKPPHAKGTTNKSHHPFRPTNHSQSRSPHVHSPLEQHAPLVPLSFPATAKGTTNKSHHTQKAPQTKATTRSGLPITVRVGIPICIHHSSNMHLLCLCLAQPPQKAPQTKATTRQRHHKQKPPHVQAYPSQSESESPCGFTTRATCTSCPLSFPATAKGTTNKSHHTEKAPQTKATTRSGLPITVRVGVPICIHHFSSMHLLCFCLAQPPRQLSAQKNSVLTLLHNPQGSLREITLRYLKEHITKLKQSCNKVAISHIRG